MEVQMSWWTMTGLGSDGREWSTEERIARIAEAGYDGISGFLPPPGEAKEWRSLLEVYGLSLSVNAYPKSVSDMERFFVDAERYGGSIRFVNAQVLTPFVIDEPAEALLRSILECSEIAGIPVYIETHRGTITQDLIRTAALAGAIRHMRLTIDFSHYVLAGEMRSVSDEAEAWLEKLLPRTGAIHARVSDGERIQADLNEESVAPMLEHCRRWWASGMKHWRNNAAPGDIFPFVCELGPPPYAMTRSRPDGTAAEWGDRWSQSAMLARIGRELWERSAAVGPLPQA